MRGCWRANDFSGVKSFSQRREVARGFSLHLCPWHETNTRLRSNSGVAGPPIRSSTEIFCVVLPFAWATYLRNLIAVLFNVFSFSAINYWPFRKTRKEITVINPCS